MKITLKTVSCKVYTVDVESTCKISELKELISQKYGFELQQIILIYNKNILHDDETISSIKYDEEKFIVLHIQIKPIQISKQANQNPTEEDLEHQEMLKQSRSTAPLDPIYEEEEEMIEEEKKEGEETNDNEDKEEEEMIEEEEEEEYGDNEEEEEDIQPSQELLDQINSFYQSLPQDYQECFQGFVDKGYSYSQIFELFKKYQNNIEALKEILKNENTQSKEEEKDE